MSGHAASFLLPNFWLSDPRPLLVRVPHPRRSELPPFLRSSPSPTRPLLLRLVLRRTRRLSHRGTRVPAQFQDIRPCAPTEEPVLASNHRLLFPGPAH